MWICANLHLNLQPYLGVEHQYIMHTNVEPITIFIQTKLIERFIGTPDYKLSLAVLRGYEYCTF